MRLEKVGMALALGVLGSFLLCAPATAQATSQVDPISSSPGAAAAKAFQAAEVLKRGAGVHVDGRLTDSIWQRAVFRTDFVQKDPVEGAPPTVRTAVAFAYDHQALYVAARMEAPPEEIRAQVTRRDNDGNSDRIKISLDSYHDRRTAYTFGVTASGVRIDYYHSSDSEHSRDRTFEPVWEASTAIDSAGWTAEMRIPFSQLRFNPAETQTWGVNINRYVPARNEDIYWVLVPKQETGWASRFGELQGLRGIEPSRRLELLPYVTGAATITGDRNPKNPFDDGRNLETRAGADLKLGLGPGLTLDAAINPDFGQVEADPAVVNLSAVETFFDERRPFFTEGSQFFRGNGASFYYSRRIGAPPQGLVGGDFEDAPKAATILGAAKVSGRLPSGTAVGALVAVTDREYGHGFDSTTNSTSRALVAPRTLFGVGRVRQEFGASASTVGLSITGVFRDLADSALAASLDRTAVAGGADWNLRFQGGKYTLSGSLGVSHVRGDTAAMLLQQTSSRRYYQRPDKGYVRLDSNRTSLTGFQGYLAFEKEGGRHWLYGVGGSFESPGFEINDLGRLGTTDDIDTWADLGYRETQPTRLFRNYSVELSGRAGWNFGGVRQYNGVELDLQGQFHNFMGGSLSLEVYPHTLSDGLTRGGPLMRTTDDVFLHGRLSSSFSSSTQWNASLTYGFDELGGKAYYASAELQVRPGSRWELSVEPEYSHTIDTRQYVTQLVGSRPEVYGGRYVFGRIDRHTLSAQFRINYAFSPDLTVELYAEPFAASGQYDALGELQAARTNDLRRYGTDGTVILRDPAGGYTISDGADTFQLDNPDFHVLSFRSNLVLRWEWRPGSTLYFVWQQNREEQDDPSRPASLRSFVDSFGGHGDNFLAIKVSYWLPVS